jgi:RNA polymerase sigma factor (sigma-70 family)
MAKIDVLSTPSLNLALERWPESFRTEFKKGLPMLYRYIRRFVRNHADADDVRQETLIEIFKHAGDAPLDRLWPWACRVARNVAMGYLRRNQRWRTAVSLGPEHEHVRSVDDSKKQLERFYGEELQRQVLELLAERNLAPKNLQAVLRRLQGEKPEKVAKELDMTPANVRLVTHRVRHFLRSALQAEV